MRHVLIWGFSTAQGHAWSRARAGGCNRWPASRAHRTGPSVPSLPQADAAPERCSECAWQVWLTSTFGLCLQITVKVGAPGAKGLARRTRFPERKVRLETTVPEVLVCEPGPHGPMSHHIKTGLFLCMALLHVHTCWACTRAHAGMCTTHVCVCIHTSRCSFLWRTLVNAARKRTCALASPLQNRRH